jgi:thiamine-monophosphate kinase
MTTPVPRVREGQALAATGAITAMMDLSDGLASDLRHICHLSQVGALVEVAALPVDAAARAVALALGDDPLWLALTGGDDYELLFTVSPGEVAPIQAALAAVDASATVIGQITLATDGIHVQSPDGSIAPLASGGWDHFTAEANPGTK